MLILLKIQRLQKHSWLLARTTSWFGCVGMWRRPLEFAGTLIEVMVWTSIIYRLCLVSTMIYGLYYDIWTVMKLNYAFVCHELDMVKCIVMTLNCLQRIWTTCMTSIFIWFKICLGLLAYILLIVYVYICLFIAAKINEVLSIFLFNMVLQRDIRVGNLTIRIK